MVKNSKKRILKILRDLIYVQTLISNFSPDPLTNS